MKKPQKFTLPRKLSEEIKRRSASCGLSASALIEVAIEYLKDAEDAKALALAQEDNTHDMIGVCYAVSESDFEFIKQICSDTGVTKRIVIMAAITVFSKNFRAPYKKTAGLR